MNKNVCSEGHWTVGRHRINNPFLPSSFYDSTPSLVAVQVMSYKCLEIRLKNVKGFFFIFMRFFQKKSDKCIILQLSFI